MGPPSLQLGDSNLRNTELIIVGGDRRCQRQVLRFGVCQIFVRWPAVAQRWRSAVAQARPPGDKSPAESASRLKPTAGAVHFQWTCAFSRGFNPRRLAPTGANQRSDTLPVAFGFHSSWGRTAPDLLPPLPCGHAPTPWSPCIPGMGYDRVPCHATPGPFLECTRTKVLHCGRGYARDGRARMPPTCNTPCCVK
jgi:hypothetical protein